MVEKQVNIRLDEGQKANWEAYVEESPEFNTISGLIRASVAREMSPGSGQASSNPEKRERFHDRLTAVEETLKAVQSSLEATEGMVARISNTVERDASLADVAPEVFAALPTVDRHKNWNDGVGVSQDVDFFVTRMRDRSEFGTVDWLAEKTGFDVSQVSDALDELQRDTARVRSVEVEGRERYWKEV